MPAPTTLAALSLFSATHINQLSGALQESQGVTRTGRSQGLGTTHLQVELGTRDLVWVVRTRKEGKKGSGFHLG